MRCSDTYASPGNRYDLKVTDVKRFFVDWCFERQTGEAADGTTPFAYDLVLTDGQRKAKVLLTPALNSWVYTGTIKHGTVLEVVPVEVCRGDMDARTHARTHVHGL